MPERHKQRAIHPVHESAAGRGGVISQFSSPLKAQEQAMILRLLVEL